MPSSTEQSLNLQPPLYLDVQRGSLQITSGDEAFRKILLSNPRYWPSATAGEGLFRRAEARPLLNDRGEAPPPLKLSLDRVLLFPERNPFDEELQRSTALGSLWRVLPDVPDKDEFQAALERRAPLDVRLKLTSHWDEVFENMVEEAAAMLRAEGIFGYLPAFVRRAHAKSRISSRWPEYKADREREFEEITAAIDAAVAPAATWETRENARIEKLRKLLAGDAAAVSAAVSDTVGGLLFPYQTQLTWSIEGSTAVRLAFSVPAVERIIPPTTRDLLANGEVRKVKREKEDLHRDFTTLIAGQALHNAAMLFAQVPSLDRVSVAAYTSSPVVAGKRSRSRAAELDGGGSYYVYEVELRRDDFEHDLAAPFDPMVFLSEHHARITALSNVALGRIEAPTWGPES